MTWNSIRLKSVRKTSMLNLVRSLEYIKCYSVSSPRTVNSLTNSIWFNCQKICSWLRTPKTKFEIRKRSHFCKWSKILLFTSFSKILPTTQIRPAGWSILVVDLSLNSDHWWDLPIIWKTRLVGAYIEEFSSHWKFRLSVLQNHH